MSNQIDLDINRTFRNNDAYKNPTFIKHFVCKRTSGTHVITPVCVIHGLKYLNSFM